MFDLRTLLPEMTKLQVVDHIWSNIKILCNHSISYNNICNLVEFHCSLTNENVLNIRKFVVQSVRSLFISIYKIYLIFATRYSSTYVIRVYLHAVALIVFLQSSFPIDNYKNKKMYYLNIPILKIMKFTINISSFRVIYRSGWTFFFWLEKRKNDTIWLDEIYYSFIRLGKV